MQTLRASASLFSFNAALACMSTRLFVGGQYAGPHVRTIDPQIWVPQEPLIHLGPGSCFLYLSLRPFSPQPNTNYGIIARTKFTAIHLVRHEQSRVL